jgi:hypothetical protein
MQANNTKKLSLHIICSEKKKEREITALKLKANYFVREHREATFGF